MEQEWGPTQVSATTKFQQPSKSVGKAAATRGGKGRCPVHVSPIYMRPNGSEGLPSVHISVNSSISRLLDGDNVIKVAALARIRMFTCVIAREGKNQTG